MVGFKKINDFMEAAFIQFYLENMDVELVYMDEFHVNIKSTKLWNLSLRGYPSFLLIDTDI